MPLCVSYGNYIYINMCSTLYILRRKNIRSKVKVAVFTEQLWNCTCIYSKCFAHAHTTWYMYLYFWWCSFSVEFLDNLRMVWKLFLSWTFWVWYQTSCTSKSRALFTFVKPPWILFHLALICKYWPVYVD